VQDYRNLRVWGAARKLAVEVARAFPLRSRRAIPELRSQAIRAARSVSSNIVEGCSRSSSLEFLNFLERSLGSLNELEDHLLFAHDVGTITSETHAKLIAQLVLTRRMLISFLRPVQRAAAEEAARRRERRRKG